MSDVEVPAQDFSVTIEESVEEPYAVEDGNQDEVPDGLEVPSNVLFVDQSGNVLGDLSMTLDPNHIPVFITHVAKASGCLNETKEAVIELSEVSPAAKRRRKEEDDDPFLNLKTWLASFQKKVNDRLKALDDKAAALGIHCQQLRQKTQVLATQVSRLSTEDSSGKRRNGTIIVGVPPSGNSDEVFPIISNVFSNTSSYQLLAHNSEEEFPDGSWLGDPADEEMRVRCPIPQKDLDQVTKSCQTGEKMALTLLDYLFDRETQACSNISGHSKHGKKQLDPVKIFGIKCHVLHNFGVDEAAWQKIKLNLDSKCRTAFRRKLKGMPLTVKAFKDGRNGGTTMPNLGQQRDQEDDSKDGGDEEDEDLSRLNPLDEEEEEDVTTEKGKIRLSASQRTYSKVQPRIAPKMCVEEEGEDETAAVLSLMEAENNGQIGEDTIPVTIHPGNTALSLPLNQLYGEPQVLFASQTPQLIQTEQGDFQIVQATPEQLAQIQQGHPVQILTTTEVPHDEQIDTCHNSC